MDREFRPGDIVRHFKRELVDQSTHEYLYRIVEVAEHTETREKYMVYKALYGDGRTYVRPFDMFMSPVDRDRYPQIKQEFRFQMDSSYVPDVKRTIRSLENNGFKVSYFENAEEAAKYIDGAVDEKTVGFGDSQTILKLGLYDRLSSHNDIYDPNQKTCEAEFQKLAKEAMDTEVFILSVNGMAETGEMVNIDGTGNRVAGSLYGHKKVIFVAGINKIAIDKEAAVARARNLAGPLDARKYNLDTPCVKGDMRCYDCGSKDRICNGQVIYLKKMNHLQEAEVVLINQDLGY